MDAIELTYDRDMERQIFKLLNVPENSDISWSTLADMTSEEKTPSNTSGTTAIFDIKKYGTRALKAEWATESKSGRNTNEVKVEARLRKKEFELKELYASHKKKRVVTSGETLNHRKSVDVTASL